jgi:hypothetical protein
MSNKGSVESFATSKLRSKPQIESGSLKIEDKIAQHRVVVLSVQMIYGCMPKLSPEEKEKEKHSGRKPKQLIPWCQIKRQARSLSRLRWQAQPRLQRRAP